jgi:mono/diheme cytochrome c family protein/plastocyanin
MTDQPGRPPEERLPAPRPPATPAPADRLSAAPSAHRLGLTPERAAKIVRQSANARWVSFLAVLVVGLFVIAYYFYELGLPGGLSQARLLAEADAQQVTSIERGYNIYQANCARCHGVDGEGGIGPVLNRQDKLFAHLSPAYLEKMLLVGGRYACGNANSLMPVWSNQGDPPGPLNYQQIDELISFIRAQKGQEYEIRDPELNEPIVDPATGKPKTFEGWVDPAYVPQPGATPYPACWQDEFSGPAPTATPGASGSPGPVEPSQPPSGVVVKESALNIQYEVRALSVPADTEFSIEFENKDPGVPHNIEIKDSSGTTVFKGDIFSGVETRTYKVQALPAGTYSFVCTVHPNMTGTLTVGG